MKKTAILIDSSSSITPKEAQERNLHFIGINILDPDKKNTYTDDLSFSLFEKISHLIEQGQMFKTNQINQARLIKIFKNLLKTHDNVIFFPITYNLSQEYESTAQLVKRKFSNKVEVVKHNLIEIALKNFVFKHYQAIQEQKLKIADLNELVANAEKNLIARMLFPSLKVLKNSGRVSNIKYKIAEILKIKIIVKYQYQEKLTFLDKTRTYSQGWKVMLDGLKQKNYNQASKKFDKDVQLYILHTCLPNNPLLQEFATYLKNEIKTKDIQFFRLSNTLLAHIGTNSIGLISFII